MIHLSFICPLTNSNWPTKSYLRRAMNMGSALSYSCCAIPGPAWVLTNMSLSVHKNLIRLWSRLNRRQIVFSCDIIKLSECFEDNQCFNSSIWSIILAKPRVWPFQAGCGVLKHEFSDFAKMKFSMNFCASKFLRNRPVASECLCEEWNLNCFV